LGWESFGDDKVPMNDAIEFLLELTKNGELRIENPVIKENPLPEKPTTGLSRETVREHLTNIPSPYFVDRGYDPKVLDMYDIGECHNEDKPMYGRAVVPIYDDDYEFTVGFTGRSLNGGKPKWKHSKDFKSGMFLFNFWFAKEEIRNTSAITVVESIGNVLRLVEAGVKNVVGLFGVSLSKGQKLSIYSSGALGVNIIMDNDEAGDKAGVSITNQLSDTLYTNVIHLPDGVNDVGEMNVSQIEEYIKPKLKRWDIF
jgi:hypothetical protein